MGAKIQIDIIILSYAKDEELKKLTKQTITTLLASEDPDRIHFNIVVIESNKTLMPYQFKNSLTIYPDEKFGFNKYLNIGIEATSNPYICLCNNDLLFHKGWASEILCVLDKNPQIKSANPFCDDFIYSVKLPAGKELLLADKKNIAKGILTGWCIFIEREIFKTIGPLDEQFNFWYADRDFAQTLLNHNIKHALILNAKVTHLGNKSHGSIPVEVLNELTHEQQIVYENKWGKDKTPFIIKVKKKLKHILKSD